MVAWNSTLLLANVVVTAFANGGARVALTWFVLHAYAPTTLSAIAIALALSQFGGSFVAGHITDRYDRKQVAVFTNAAAASGFLLVGVAISADFGPIVFCGLACLATSCLAIHDNATRTLIPSITGTDDVKRVNGYFISLLQVGYFASPLTVGWLIQKSSVPVAMTCMAVMLGVASALLLLIRMLASPSAKSAADKTAPPRVTGALFLDNRWLMFGLAAAAAANFFILSIAAIAMPLHLKNIGLNSVEFGYFGSALSLGFALAGVASRRGPSQAATRLQLCFYLLAPACAYLTIVLLDSLVPILLCAVFAGVLMALFEINWNSILQERSPADLLGRLYGIGSWTSFAARSLGTAAVGMLAGWLTVQSVVSLSVVGMTLALALLSWLTREGPTLRLERSARADESA